MPRPGANNLITDVGDIEVGHATDERWQTGVTTLLCARAMRAAVDVRGGGPGTRETDALGLPNLVGSVHAIVLSGGSVFGLAAADGVTTELSARGAGLRLRPATPAIPIVPCAVLHDLSHGVEKTWGTDPPYRQLGAESLASAAPVVALGAVGAGRGAMAGLVKGGIGSASLDLGGGLIAGALVAVNCVGSVLMPDGETFWAWPLEIDAEFGGHGRPRQALGPLDPIPGESKLSELGRLQAGANTTLAIVACNADLSGAECQRVAIMAHDGLARAVRPAHTPFDGDLVFALATGAVALEPARFRALEIARIGSASADCLARAIARGVHRAASAAPLSSQTR